MKSKVLLTHSYFYKHDPKQWQIKQPYPPLGTLLAGAVMKAEDFDVALFDVALEENPDVLIHTLKKEKPAYFIIYDDGFNYLTKMCLTAMREAAFKMIELAKKSGCVVMVSSSDSTDHYEKYFKQGADYVIRGEGEDTLRELLKTLERKEKPNGVLGLAFVQEGQTIVTPSRPVIRNLDSLPSPAWELIDLEPYRKIWLKHHGYFSLNIATTRGCPYKCNWCAKPIYGNRYNSRSPKKVVDEIKYLLTHYTPTHFWMCDDIFGLKPKWIQEFKDEVVSRNLKFKYKIQSRADLLLEEDTIEALSQSGAETIWIGAESGSQKILDAMDKGTTVEQIKEARQLLKRKGIKVAFFLQFGYLGETKEDIDATLKMVLDLMPDEIGISVSYPLPGTKFYDKVKSQLTAKQNWKDSDDLEMMFQSTFNSTYYRQLHRYVHHTFSAKRGLQTVLQLLQNPLLISLNTVRRSAATLYHVLASKIQSRSINSWSR
jgi:anaerobic magnesium-protoporphyrin IX monomethyl ester cyclase